MGELIAPDLDDLRAFTARLRVVSADGDPGLGIDLLDAIETLKSVGCAVQAMITDDVATNIRADRQARRLPQSEGVGVSRHKLRWDAENPRTGTGGIWVSRRRWYTKCRIR